ncbi:hypothetical protein BKA67DRAFT_656385 [Truncatella angustata]|uniref:Uncharacterized protein n=1 Tax=Truncatella angustata TaxID=152316 RepID=A0A9P8UTR2_9PEZI|nr:uncharacterized protein BKA67DRAFT_656385 [Truncatella angustata]KAH6658166.1 hypothetical protein BKA67DRAFT_656385 [Truncatella angustata]KAH8199192.1 hypothetical protein TruAng_006661 [Truncatella angustata]
MSSIFQAPWVSYFLTTITTIIYLLVGLTLCLIGAHQESWYELRKWHRRYMDYRIGGSIAYEDIAFWPLTWTGIVVYTVYRRGCFTSSSIDGELHLDDIRLLEELEVQKSAAAGRGCSVTNWNWSYGGRAQGRRTKHRLHRDDGRQSLIAVPQRVKQIGLWVFRRENEPAIVEEHALQDV